MHLINFTKWNGIRYRYLKYVLKFHKKKNDSNDSIHAHIISSRADFHTQ